jgi:hypothetical protein
MAEMAASNSEFFAFRHCPSSTIDNTEDVAELQGLEFPSLRRSPNSNHKTLFLF